MLNLESNGHLRLRSDGKSFRVNNSTIPKRDANSGRKMRTDFADLSASTLLDFSFFSPVNIKLTHSRIQWMILMVCEAGARDIRES